MDAFSNTNDYSFIDEYINRSLTEFNKKLFGEYDDKTGYFEELSNDTDENTPEDNLSNEQTVNSEEEAVNGMMEEEMYNYLFGFDSRQPEYQVTNDSESVNYSNSGFSSQDVSNIKSSGEFGNKNIGQRGKQIYDEVSSLLGYNPVANSIYRSKEQNDRLIKEGKPASKTSYHLTGDAIDFKPSDWAKLSAEQKKNLKQKYDVIYHNNHYHVEPKQAGGAAIAHTPTQQYIGLNDESLNTLFMPLQGQNPIRGLDSGQPVYVKDQTGKSEILYGPDDVVNMTGAIYEKKLSKKYKAK